MHSHGIRFAVQALEKRPQIAQNAKKIKKNLHISKNYAIFAAAFKNTLMAIEIREVNTKRQL
ncbi:MAG: hypothetical protein ACI4TV_06665, partial [Paludibacteraceae bacterium]